MVGSAGRYDVGGRRLLPGWLRVPGRGAAEHRFELERALNDGPAAGLSALAVELDLFSAMVGDLRLTSRVEVLRERVYVLIENLRQLGGALHPPVLTEGLEPACVSVAERYDLRIKLDLPEHDLDAQARMRTGLLVADHLRTLEPGTTVRVRVRGRRVVRVRITEQRPGSSVRRNLRAVLLCG
ncbi:hypothetical protein QFW96_03260 [Saccharopolyspora sp. TS4A08]|uniref:Histidine kinase n=1 Tax=Saccharopolyspora ipomoeae TaxID=3042027 RepID=A0ABT6PHZ9_9PSEU|nr:hypothetical protein [Saccharopolyspora sp. TS4A08]MDI2027610.1 hypothetical protein [Saccharopolyspora sp. TS4A08]